MKLKKKTYLIGGAILILVIIIIVNVVGSRK